MYAETTWRSWLDELGWVPTSDTIRTRGLPPSDRRLARHLAALRRAWCDTVWNNSEEPCSDDGSGGWITDNNSDIGVASNGAPTVEPQPVFTKARLDTMIAERIATIHGLGIIDARDLEELDICITSLRLGTALDITLLQLRRIDELLARHTLGEATYRQMVADRQRAASNQVDRSIGGAPVPSICSPAQRKHAVETLQNDEPQGTPDGQRTPILRFEAKRGTPPQGGVPTAASLRILQTKTVSTPAHQTNIMSTQRAEQTSPTRDEHALNTQRAWSLEAQRAAPADGPTSNVQRARSTTQSPNDAQRVQPDSPGEAGMSARSLPCGGDNQQADDRHTQQPLLQSGTMSGTTNVVPHKMITKIIADFFATDKAAPSLWLMTTRSAQNGQGEHWVGRVDRQWRNRRVGPWDVRWTHRRHPDNTWDESTKDGAAAPLVEKIPCTGVTYTQLDVTTPPPTTPPAQPATTALTKKSLKKATTAPRTGNTADGTATATVARAPSAPLPVDQRERATNANAQQPPLGPRIKTTLASPTTQGPDCDDDHTDAGDDDEDEDADDDMAPLPAMWAAADVPTSVFQCGGATTPCLAALKGSHLMTMILDDSKTPTLAKYGLVKTTRQGHKRILREMVCMPQHLQGAPLVTAIIESINAKRREKRWQWSTTLTRMAATQGALRLLPLYSGHETIDLRDNPMWAQAMRTARRETQCEVGYQPKAITAEDLRAAVAKEPSQNVRMALVMAWATAARGGCTLQLRLSNVELSGSNLQVQFRHGKSVIARGPYTVHTAIPQWALGEFRMWLGKKRQGLLFQGVTGEQLKLALRRVDKLYEQRSIRRGSLQAMSLRGCSDEDLLLYSGHTNLKTLRRYLDWGKKSGDLQRRMPQHAEAAL